MKIESVKIEKIDCASADFDAFVFSFPGEGNELRESIREVGLLQPVCLLLQQDLYRIIFGAKRIAACRELGWDEIPARVITDTISPEQGLQISLQEDLHQRELNVIEKANVLDRFQRYAQWDLQRLTAELTSQLTLPASAEMVQNYLDLLTLSPEIKLELATGEIGPGHGFVLLQGDNCERSLAYEHILKPCQPTLSEFREIIAAVSDLKIILDQSLEQILQREELAFLKSTSMNSRHKCTLLRTALKKLRYPNLSRYEEIFSDAMERLSLPETVRVRYAPFFENEGLDIAFKARNETELQQTLEHLQHKSQTQDMKTLFKLTRGEA